MRDPAYDIFRGTSRENAVWLEAVEGLQTATDRMGCLALLAPDDYFLFHSSNIVASIQNSNDALQPETSSVRKIVILSSDSNHAGTLAAILKKQGMESITTSTVSQYRDLLSKQPINLVFCDPTLPDGDYRNVINASLFAGSKARVVVTSRLADWPEFHDAICAGAFDVISQPCHPKDVEWMVIQARRDERKMAKQLMTSSEKSLARGAA